MGRRGRIVQIDPLDIQPRKAVGINLPLSGPAVFNPNFTTRQAIKFNIINYVLTVRNERYLNSDYGLDIRRFVFEQMTDINYQDISEFVEEKITEQFDRITNVVVELTPNEAQQSVTLKVSYQIKNSEIEDSLLVNLQ